MKRRLSEDARILFNSICSSGLLKEQEWQEETLSTGERQPSAMFGQIILLSACTNLSVTTKNTNTLTQFDTTPGYRQHYSKVTHYRLVNILECAIPE